MVKNLPAMQETQLDFWARKIPWRRERQPTPYILAWRIPRAEKPTYTYVLVAQLCLFAAPWTRARQAPLSKDS